MFKGVYTAASSMIALQEKMNLISNNLANVSTSGYKKDEGIQESFPEMLISRLEKGQRSRELGPLGTGVQLQQTYTDFSQGTLLYTGNRLDLALEGDGFFVVQTPNGLRYTRNGNFTLNEQGIIVTNQGYPVLGEDGPLQTIPGRGITVNANGQLYFDGIQGGRILVVDFPEPALLDKIGENLYSSDYEPEVLAGNFAIRQGFLENSNVNIIQEMVKMIQVNRHYELNQRVIATYDGTMDKAVNNVGNIG